MEIKQARFMCGWCSKIGEPYYFTAAIKSSLAPVTDSNQAQMFGKPNRGTSTVLCPRCRKAAKVDEGTLK